jgi:hypothetical protein
MRMVQYLKVLIEGKEECNDERCLVTFSGVALGPSCPAVVPQFFTTWAHQAHMQHMHMHFCYAFS